MDIELVERLIARDWPDLQLQARRLRLGDPAHAGTRIDLRVRPTGTQDDFLAVLLCDEYDAHAPLLDFADIEDPQSLGPANWPKMKTAPMNSVNFGGRQVPIICTPGTRGYHEHPSHRREQHDRSIWRLPAVATLVARFLTKMGPYEGRGL